MAITINMPALSPTMTEGKIAKWIKKEGDSVRPGDVIAEIETDKAAMEVEASDEGTLAKIIVAEGTEHVAVRTVIAVLAEEGDDAKAIEAAVKNAAAAPVAAPAAPAAPAPVAAAPVAQAAPAPVAAPKPKPVAPAPKPVATGGRVIASPLARRMAREAGIDLARISGTGPHGRIIRVDVENAPAGGGSGGIFAGSGQAFPPAVARTEPLNQMRKIIAERLTLSKQTVPHFYASVDCDIDALLALRKEINDSDEGIRVSVNDFVIRAVALALIKVPAANASWGDDGMNYYSAADISVAVSTDGGLITPIVKSANKKGIAAISGEVKDLAGRARDGKLLPEEFMGGTFTISNMGMYGIRDFCAIINPPQACILAVGAGEERVVAKDGEIGTATLMTCTLSCDHRAVDGAVGAEFLGAFKEFIEHPIRLIL
ncbi:MAG: pyruvate dehydrogenase complex dihydrolipoamide acetyltransferase [Rhodospirillales bacterium]|nr:pyruvate dehydrogenase complex dihydrolipoamide acetyltransferase [Rhodospirillales bacterium]